MSIKVTVEFDDSVIQPVIQRTLDDPDNPSVSAYINRALRVYNRLRAYSEKGHSVGVSKGCTPADSKRFSEYNTDIDL